MASDAGSRLGANFWRLWSASAASNLADGVFRVALPLLALTLTRSPSAVAGVTIATRLPWLLFALQAGALADRLDRRRTMTAVNLARASTILGLAALVATDTAGLPVLYAAAFGLGVLETLFDTAAQSIMPNVVDQHDLPKANGRLGAIELSMNQFIGPPLGGIIAGLALTWAFIGSGAAYLVAATVLVFLSGSYRPTRSGPPTRLRTDIAEGLRYLWANRLLRTLAILVGGMNFVSSGVEALLPVYAVAPGPLGLSAAGFGLLWASVGAGSLVGSVVADKASKSVGRQRLLVLNVAFAGLFPIALATTSSVVLIGVAFAAIGVLGMIWNVITVSLRQAIVPDHMLGRINAGYRVMAWGSMPAGAAAAGLGAELVGARTVFAVLGGLALLLVIPMLGITEATIESAETGQEPPAEKGRADSTI